MRYVMHRNLAVLLTALLSTSPLSYAQGDAESGRKKAKECFACHGETGISKSPEWPSLAGQKQRYMINQLKAFRSGVRNSPLMNPVAARLSDRDIEDITRYFSEQGC